MCRARIPACLGSECAQSTEPSTTPENRDSAPDCRDEAATTPEHWRDSRGNQELTQIFRAFIELSIKCFS